MEVIESYRYPKENRLHHRSLVEGLFREGKSFYEFPFRVVWRLMSAEEITKNFRSNVPSGIGAVQMMVTVPKKKRRRAVDRVKIRRRIREAYRLNRREFESEISSIPGIGTLSVGMVYIHSENMDYHGIEEKVKRVISQLQKRIMAKKKELVSTKEE
ncbi:MAG: ribonuclease P protein component [Muribaculaceae bacterium]|nr:ribonuclease P protein component [Muribaculaceae bacterium]